MIGEERGSTARERGSTARERGAGTPRRPRPHDGDPLEDAVGTVRVHPDDDRTGLEARRVIKSSTGGWVHLTQGEIPAPARPWEELRAWPRQSLAELARILGHVDAPERAHHRDLPEHPPPAFWEAAKTYCRALAAESRSSDYWYERYCAATGRGAAPAADPWSGENGR